MNSPPSIIPDYSDSGGGVSGVQSITAGTNITVTGTPTDPIINASSSNVPRPSTIIYVSPSGNDTTANGSLSLPFLTIQGAINYRNTLSNTLNVEIFIFGGNYAENLSITVPNTFFTCNSAPYLGVKTVLITGTVTVNINVLTGQGSGEVSFTNIGWLSTGITTGSTVAQGLHVGFYNCFILGWALHNQDSPTTYSVRYYDTFLQHTGTEGLIISVGCLLQILRCELIHTNNTTNPIINIQNGGGGGSGSLNLQYTNIRSTTTSATAQPIIRYQNTSTSSSGNIMSYNTLTYTSQVVDTGFNKCCIQYNQTGAITVDMMSFNTFDCDGAIYTGGQPYAIQKRGAGAVTIAVFGGNFGGVQAHRIDPAITRTSTMILTA